MTLWGKGLKRSGGMEGKDAVAWATSQRKMGLMREVR
jgi:hypothetical protein